MAFKPIDASNACLRRSRRFLLLSDKNLPDQKIKNDLRRTAIVMSVAAIDSYMHWLVLQRISKLRKEGEIPNLLKKYHISFSDLARLADSTIAQRKKGKDFRPWVLVKNSLQKQILTDTFQSFDQVSSAFAMAGINKPWKSIAAELGTTPEEIKRRLTRIVHRRNQVVHEGDIKRSTRPRKLQYNSVDQKEIKDDVNWIDSLIKGVEKVILV